jgi:signal recognition particle GTPase
MGMGSLSKIASMIPGMPAGMMDGNEEDTSAKLKRMVFITDAMRQDELDSDGLIFVSFCHKSFVDGRMKADDPRSNLTKTAILSG